jgi:phospholipase/carboxylesterase
MASSTTNEEADSSSDDMEDPEYYFRHMDYTVPLVVPPKRAPHTGTVIFLHGAGDSGPGVAQWVASSLGKVLRFPHLKTLFPSASLRPYTSAGDQNCRVWFDFPKGIQYDVPEDIPGIDESTAVVTALIEKEIHEGIPPRRIMLGGLSQGGILALHVGLRLQHTLAGIFVLSSYLPKESRLLSTLQSKQVEELPQVPIYVAHGDLDNLIRPEWGKSTCKRLQELGMTATYKEYTALSHGLCREEIRDLKSWIKERVPSDQ